MPESNSIDFSTVLASSVHDMKNSLSLMLQSIESLNTRLTEQPELTPEVSKLHYETNRLNANLIQLLGLYRSQINQLPLNIEENYLDELFEEVLVKNQLYIHNKDIETLVEVDEDVSWFFDSDLITHLINDIYVNAIRYAKSTIKLSAHIKDNALVVCVEDDGDGFPDEMQRDSEANGFSLSAGRTGLGLFFAKTIAQAHKNSDSRGEIILDNSSSLGGGRFTLKLP